MKSTSACRRAIGRRRRPCLKDSERPGKEAFPLTNNSHRRIAPKQTVGVLSAPSPSAWTYTRRALIGMMCLLCVVGGTVTGNFYWKSAIFRSMFNGALSGGLLHGNTLAAFTPENQFPPEKQHTMNVMFLGCDSDWDPKKPIELKNRLTRSDAILIAHLDFDAKTIHALSIPRDTAVRIPDNGYNKINAAHALGGPALTQQTIKAVFGIDVDYYMTLNFDGFMKVVDSLGGVDVTVQKKLDYDDNWGNLHVHLKPGLQHLNGYRAMGYVRIRHTDDDLQRAARQQDFMEALRARIKSPANLLRLPDALNAITDSIKTDMTQEQMVTVANFARTLPKANIEVGTLPVTEGPSYVYIKRDEDADIIRKYFYNDDKMIEVAVNPPSDAIVARLTRKLKHKKHRRRATAVSGPKDDEGQPLLSNQDAPTTDDGGDTASADKTAPADAPAPDSGGAEQPAPEPRSDPKPDKSDGKKDGKKDSGGDKSPPASPDPEPKGGKPDAGAPA